MRKNYVMIDGENVQQTLMNELQAAHFHIHLFLGVNQTKVTVETAEALRKMGERARFIQCPAGGKNALDFLIAFQIGKISAIEPDAFFHIISRDAGFDPLIIYMKSKQVSAARHDSVSDIPLLKSATVADTKSRATLVMTRLDANLNSRPASVKTLTNMINSVFGKELNNTEVVKVINQMQNQGFITLENTRIKYASGEPTV